MGIDVFRKHSAERAKVFADYFDYASKSDLFLTYVIINPQAERGKTWGEQAEDLVARMVDEDFDRHHHSRREDARHVVDHGERGLRRQSATAEAGRRGSGVFLRGADERQGPARAVAQVVRRAAVSVYDNPISSRFDENDALMYFDDVKVPWDRVFVYRDPDMCRAQFHDTQGHVYQNYQSQIRLSVKIAFLAGIAHRVTEAIGTTKIPQVAEQLGMLAAQVGMVNAMMSGMEASGSQVGEWYVPNKHFMYSAQVLTQDLYPKVRADAFAISPAAR